MTMRALLSALASALSPALLCCAPTDVVVGDVTGLDGGDAATDAPIFTGDPCTTNDDCSSSSYCARHACDEPMGHCRPRPLFCENTRAFSCGCDGVTYWNDCLREFVGTTAAVQGDECGRVGVMPAHCDTFPMGPPPDDGGAPLPPKNNCPVEGASCAHIDFTGMCGGGSMMHPIDGHCWVLPPECPADDGFKWTACVPGPLPCAGMCEAIRNQQPYVPSLKSACP
jgi:hypothetical protein